ncbi:2,3-dihydro-3-hydroxyanthranilate isomerase (plasmid) [Burkholderia ubonensis]|uniref:2,3-dihydro-3-hydroxyanthranilate isomerase n=1 Tax=Burkholderia ubonensis TaxID=101571 RepID=A0A124R8U5_9BURK|nr:PhzF family phenazine biosynthesis isomerase [Burkholderia ubonensis]AOJ64616.1 2,3-dihydro-3-hydroxyanthranilate isomerase [Burkholderia ubonensis]KVG59360.1 2,3-dihydro-3-hydroxyanthranilate isomerase [Burkholderia ubonensis]
MKTSRYVIADVFTDRPLEGNPVAVFVDASGLDATDMQRIARETNLSETTFVFPPKADGDVHVRIFTPVNELPFAGHPTLGTAIVLGETHAQPVLRMETAMGTVPFTFERTDDGRIRSATMQQPIPTWEPYEHAQTLLEGLGLASSTLPVELYRNGPRHVFVGLPDIDALSAVKPDLRILATLPDMAANCFAGSGGHWRMRMFSPAYGVAEDAATGSAAGPLAWHLIRHGLVGFGQTIEIWQGVEMGRLSIMSARVDGSSAGVDAIQVSGSAMIVARGELLRWRAADATVAHGTLAGEVA